MELPRVENFLLVVLPICWKGNWLTVDEMTELTHLHPSSVRWCIKKLTTGPEGEFIVRRRRRQMFLNPPMEFYIKRKPAQMRFAFEGKTENRNAI